MKRGYFIFLLFALSILLFSGGVIAAEDSGFKEDASALWNNITESTSNVYDKVVEGVDRVFGFKTLEGEEILRGEGEFDLTLFLVFNIIIGLFVLGTFIFFLWHDINKNTPSIPAKLIISGVLGFVIVALAHVSLSKIIIFPATSFLTISLPATIWVLLFTLITVITTMKASGDSVGIFSMKISKTLIPLGILTFYPFLTLVPILNRILNLLTLEVLGLHWFWRALIIASVLYFGPLYYSKYKKHRIGMYNYNRALKKVAREEAAAGLLKR